MYSFLSRLLLTGKLKFKIGEISVFNTPFALIPMASIKYMTEDILAKNDSKALNDLYMWGWVYGYTVTKELIKLFNLKKFEERYKISMDTASLVGFGDYQTLSFKRADHARFKVIGNPFAKQFYKSDQFVCHYLRGMEAGGGTLVHEISIDNLEFECAARNNLFCLHQNLSQENIDKLDKKFVNKQLDRNYLRKRKIEFLESIGDDPSKFDI